MSNKQERTLIASINKGRYTADHPRGIEWGTDLTDGQRLAIRLGGQWIEGIVEYGTMCYCEDYHVEQHLIRGYYFRADTGELCGLCIGMTVRLLEKF